MSDDYFMSIALRMAQRALGQSAPNPAVGCVLVKDNLIIGRGWTGKGGRPHAETEALAQAGNAAKGAIAYITLEPCCHEGQTPPCTDALINAGIKRAVIATQDPDSRVSGNGISALRQAGISVEIEVRQKEANELNAGFFSKITKKCPLVTLKLATTLDGKIATKNGDSKWITGNIARSYGHMLRYNHDAIMVGSGTVNNDNPSLTCRLPGLDNSNPVRVIMDSKLALCPDSNLAKSAKDVPVWVFATKPDEVNKKNLQICGVKIIQVAEDEFGKVDFMEVMAVLAERGITRLLIEGGGKIAATALKNHMVDGVSWFHGAKIIGNDGIPAIADMGVTSLEKVPSFSFVKTKTLGDSSVSFYKNNKS